MQTQSLNSFDDKLNDLHKRLLIYKTELDIEKVNLLISGLDESKSEFKSKIHELEDKIENLRLQISKMYDLTEDEKLEIEDPMIQDKISELNIAIHNKRPNKEIDSLKEVVFKYYEEKSDRSIFNLQNSILKTRTKKVPVSTPAPEISASIEKKSSKSTKSSKLIYYVILVSSDIKSPETLEIDLSTVPSVKKINEIDDNIFYLVVKKVSTDELNTKYVTATLKAVKKLADKHKANIVIIRKYSNAL